MHSVNLCSKPLSSCLFYFKEILPSSPYPSSHSTGFARFWPSLLRAWYFIFDPVTNRQFGDNLWETTRSPATRVQTSLEYTDDRARKQWIYLGTHSSSRKGRKGGALKSLWLSLVDHSALSCSSATGEHNTRPTYSHRASGSRRIDAHLNYPQIA